VRDRWRERRLRGRPDPPRDTAASTFVVHAAPAVGGGADEADTGAMIAADVVARHAAMEGARVENVAAHPRSPVADEVRRRLVCDDDDILRYDVVRPSYVDSVWWAIEQLWQAGLLRERSATTTTCDHCGRPGVPTDASATRDAPALVRFPVTGEGALHTAGASLLVTAQATAVPVTTAVGLSPDIDRVLAQAVDDAYPVVIARATVAAVLGDDATVHRDVGVDELLAVTCRHPLDDRAGPLTVVPAPQPAHDAATGAHPLSSATTAGPAARGSDEAREVPDRADATLTELRQRGLLLEAGPRGGDPDATACTTCGAAGTPATRPQWVVTTSGWSAQLREEHHRVARRGAPPVAGWALGDDDWVVTSAAGSGAPLPLWRCERCDAVTAVAGRSQLATLTGEELTDADPTDDEVARATFACRSCPDGTATRVPLTLDRRFVGAVMPFARFGFPAVRGSDGRFARRHHADVVVDRPSAETADATLTVATLLWGAGVHDVLLSIADLPDADDHVIRLCDGHGSDAVRWAIVAAGTHHGGEDLETLARTAHRDIIEPLRHACTVVCMVAEDGGLPSADAVRARAVDDRDAWDRWLLAELSTTVDAVRSHLAAADPGTAVSELHAAVARLAAWMRHRGVEAAGAMFDADALATAHEYLVTLAALLAPFMPVVADEVYEALVRAGNPTAPDSVHLLRYPIADPRARDDDLRDRMRTYLRADAGDGPDDGAPASNGVRTTSASPGHPPWHASRDPAVVR
jgi:isoleucyl-tRNA synthetase